MRGNGERRSGETICRERGWSGKEAGRASEGKALEGGKMELDQYDHAVLGLDQHCFAYRAN